MKGSPFQMLGSLRDLKTHVPTRALLCSALLGFSGSPFWAEGLTGSDEEAVWETARE